jgi:hypothetical protein
MIAVDIFRIERMLWHFLLAAIKRKGADGRILRPPASLHYRRTERRFRLAARVGLTRARLGRATDAGTRRSARLRSISFLRRSRASIMAKTSTIVSAAVRSRLPTPGLIIFKVTSQAKVAGPADARPAHARRRLSGGRPYGVWKTMLGRASL